MQTKTRLFLIPLAVCFALVGLTLSLPHLVDFSRIREQMVQQVCARLGSKIGTGRLDWVWYPLPHLVLNDLRFTDDNLALTAPHADAYPDWLALCLGEIRLGGITLSSPELTVKQLPLVDEKLAEDLFDLKISVSNGRLQLPTTDHWSLVRTRTSSIRAIDGRISLRRGALTFDLSGTPSFGERLDLAGTLSPDHKRLSLNFDGRKIKADQAISSLVDGRLVPLPGQTSFRAGLEIQDDRIVGGSFKGDLPALLAFPADRKIPLHGGSAKLAFSSQGEKLTLAIDSFTMKDPGLAINGTVRRSPGIGQNSAPIWDIDLKGADFDLDRLRLAVLSMWGEDKYAKQAADIVQGGKAGKLGFSFHGPAEKLNSIENFTVSMEKIDASIKIPAGGLLVTEAKGSAIIKNGKLYVNNATARYGNSRGRNGSMELGLADHDFTFRFDLDLDADLAELPEALRRLVKHKPFQDELALFDKVSGKAAGHLHLGHHLEKFTVEVEVAAMQGKGRYLPMGRDFSIESGKLSIAPSLVKWQEVRGNFGPHRINRASGQVRFNDEILLDLSAFDAVLVAQELKRDNLTWLANQSAAIRQNLNQVAGKVELRDTSLSVRSSAPDQWQGKTTLLLADLLVESPHLPEVLKIKKGRIDYSEKTLNVTGLSASLFGDPVSMSAALTHRQLAELKGRISLDGRVSQRLGAWFRKKRIIPEEIFPRLPMQASGLTFDLSEGKIVARGAIRSEGSPTQTAQLGFLAEIGKDGLLKATARVQGENEAATLYLDFPDGNTDTFFFSWKGNLSQKTADRLLQKNTLLNGSIVGDFQISMLNDPGKPSFLGQISAKNLHLRPAPVDLDFRELRLEGSAGELHLKNLVWALNQKEVLSINGLARQHPTGIGMNLNLTAPYLAKKTLTDLLESLQKNRKKNSGQGRFQNITGTVDFKVNEFLSSPPIRLEKEISAPPLTWRPLNGQIRIMRDWKMAVDISSAGLCGLSADGTWFSTPELGRGRIAIKSTGPSLPRFEEVLPCLGYPQDIIAGGFSMEGSLVGSPDHWSEGKLLISSEQGRILRLKLLSKIFSVVNITDFLVPIQQEEGKNAGEKRGFPYSEMVLKSHIKNNELFIDEGVIRGEGLNIFARGKINLSTFEVDMVVLIAPFKTIDAIVSKIPLLGKLIGGETGTVLTFPVGLTGNLKDPNVTPLSPSAVGESLFHLVKRTLLLPFTILSPIFPDSPTKAEPQ